MKMTVSKTLVRKIVIALVVALAAGLVLGSLKSCRYIITDVKKGKQRQVRLLCETDHKALLEACRELSRRVITGDMKPRQYNVRLDPHPEASRFPQPILDLEPTYVIIESNGCIIVELYGLFNHFGLYAYPEDFKEPFSNFEYGNKKLIDGLWYYDDGYREAQNYDKKIEALIQKGKEAH